MRLVMFHDAGGAPIDMLDPAQARIVNKELLVNLVRAKYWEPFFVLLAGCWKTIFGGAVRAPLKGLSQAAECLIEWI